MISNGLLADYQFAEGSGSTTADSSGNGHTGTFLSGAHAPTWSSAGLVCNGSQGFTTTLPSAGVLTAQILCSCAAGMTTYGFILGDNNNSINTWQLGFRLQNQPANSPKLPSPGIFNGGSFVTSSGDCVPTGVPFLFSYTEPGTNDLLYINTRSCIYETQGNTAGVARTGNVIVGVWGNGGSGYGNYGFQGTIHRVVLYNRALSAAEVATNAAEFATFAASRGVPLNQPNPSTERVLAAVGDSITYGYGISNPWPTSMTLTNPWTVYNFGNSSEPIGPATYTSSGQLYNMLTDQAWINPFYSSAAPMSVVTIMAGTNDFVLESRTAAAVFADLQTLVNGYVAQGFDVVVIPMIDRGSVATATKNAYNALMATAWGAGTTPNVRLVPTSAMPNLVPDGSSTNTTYFQSDMTHPTQTGANQIASAVAAVVNSPATATGYTFTGPTSGLENAASSNFTVTPTGGIYTGTITITPSGGGLSSPIVLTFAASSTAQTFTITPTALSTVTLTPTNNGSLPNPSALTYSVTEPSAPTTGAVAFGSATTTTVSVTGAAATGGEAPLSYHWYYSGSPSFTPPGQGTAISGATSYSGVTFTPPDKGLYYVKLLTTDANGLTAVSDGVAISQCDLNLVVGFVGNSQDALTNGYNSRTAAIATCDRLKNLLGLRTVTCVNEAVSSTAVSDWITTGSTYTTAKAAFIAAGVNYVMFDLGLNDAFGYALAGPTASPSQPAFQSGVSAICNDLVASGMKVVLNNITGAVIPYGATATLAAGYANMVLYHAAFDALVDNVNIFRGDTTANRYFADHYADEFESDGRNPNATGTETFGTLRAIAFVNNVLKIGGGGVGVGSRSRNFSGN